MWYHEEDNSEFQTVITSLDIISPILIKFIALFCMHIHHFPL